MNTNKFLLLVGLAFISLNCFADLKDAPMTLQSGYWKVLRSIDPMKDTVNCTGIYKENYGVQLTSDTLFIRVKGGLQSVTLRYGDDQAMPFRLPTDMEKKLSSVIISKADFEILRAYDRIRLQAGVLIGGIVNDEISLNGFKDALANIRDKCPLPAVETKKEVIDTPGQPQPQVIAQVCSDLIISRMKTLKLKESQILMICK